MIITFQRKHLNSTKSKIKLKFVYKYRFTRQNQCVASSDHVHLCTSPLYSPSIINERNHGNYHDKLYQRRKQ